MSNTLDNILIKYHGQSTDKNIKTITFQEFIDFEKVPPETLTKQEHELQQAMADLYRLNDRKPPLFQSFPDWRPNKPLTIDATSFNIYFASETGIAAYNSRKNTILFKHDASKETPLIATLAHELKHAEQYSQEVFEMESKDNFSRYQLGTIKEIDSCGFELCVWILHCLEKSRSPDEFISPFRGFFNLTGASPAKWKDLYEKMQKRGSKKYPFDYQDMLAMQIFSNMATYYKDEYDFSAPIHDTDVGIDHIPDSFHLGPEYLYLCMAMPRNAKKRDNHFIQLLFNNHEQEAKDLLEQAPKKEKDAIIDTATSRVFWPPIGLPLKNKNDLNKYEKKLQQHWAFLEQHREAELDPEKMKHYLYRTIAMGMPNLTKDLLATKNHSKPLFNHHTICTIFGLCCLGSGWTATVADGLGLSPIHMSLAHKQMDTIAEIFLDLKDKNGNHIITANDLKKEKDPGHVLARYWQKHPKDPRFATTTVHNTLTKAAKESDQNKKSSSSRRVSDALNDKEHT